MGAESNMRGRVVHALRSLKAFAVENACLPGTPDVTMLTGLWMELKQIPAWPVRVDTLVRVDHFRPEQRIWLSDWSAAGGRCCVLLRVHRDWLWLEGGWAADNLGHVTRATLLRSAVKVWEGGLNEKELLDACR